VAALAQPRELALGVTGGRSCLSDDRLKLALLVGEAVADGGLDLVVSA
jgi:hypothetical protein